MTRARARQLPGMVRVVWGTSTSYSADADADADAVRWEKEGKGTRENQAEQGAGLGHGLLRGPSPTSSLRHWHLLARQTLALAKDQGPSTHPWYLALS